VRIITIAMNVALNEWGEEMFHLLAAQYVGRRRELLRSRNARLEAEVADTKKTQYK